MPRFSPVLPRQDAEQLGKLLPFDLSVGIQKGLRLRERGGPSKSSEAVPGVDQAGDGTVPAELRQ